MIKAITLLRRRPGITVSDFQSHWRKAHADLIARLPGVRRYVQSRPVPESHTGGMQPICDGIAELWADDSQAFRDLGASPEYAAVLADEERFLDRSANVLLLVDDHLLKDGPVTAASIKEIRFLKRRGDLAVADFQQRWREIVGPRAAMVPAFRRCVQSHARAGAYQGEREPRYDGFEIAWYDSIEALRAAADSPEGRQMRADREALLAGDAPVLLTYEYLVMP